MSKSLNELAKDIHENAVAHGWWDGEGRTFGDVIALCPPKVLGKCVIIIS